MIVVWFAKALGYVAIGVSLAAYALGWVAWHWFTGTPFRRGLTGRRRVTRPVRATAQTLPVAVAVAFGLWPAVTIWVTVSTVLSLAALVGGYRTRLWLDAREAAKPVVKADRVEVGEPIRPTPPPLRVEVIELPWEDRAAITRRLARELEAAA